MALTIDGVTITKITVDGVEQSEVNIDGVTVFTLTAPVVVDLSGIPSNINDIAQGVNNAEAGYHINSDKTHDKQQGGSLFAIAPNWLNASGVVGDYDVRLQVLSGIDPNKGGSDFANVWFDSASNRNWDWIRTTLGTTMVDVRVQVRRKSDLVVVDTREFSIELTKEP